MADRREELKSSESSTLSPDSPDPNRRWRRVSTVEVVAGALPSTKKKSFGMGKTPEVSDSEADAEKQPWWKHKLFMPNPSDSTGPPADVVIDPVALSNGGGIDEKTRTKSSTSMMGEDKGGELYRWGSSRSTSGTGNHNLALYEEGDTSQSLMTHYIRGYTTPGPLEREESKKKKADLGTMLGVYLPTIQHILGVTMFIRLFWVVGVAGLGQTFMMLAVCCICTFLTCISLSAVATNGTMESGGAYFMISRNLGPEFGSAVGILFYLANTVATAMYLVGGTEVFLLYLFPGLTIGGPDVHSHTDVWGMMTNNLRIYSTLFLILEFCIVAMGVKFVQLLAPVSLVCVIASILACYAGGAAKTFMPDAGPYVCAYGEDVLLQAKIVLPDNGTLDDIPDYCTPDNHVLVARLMEGERAIPHFNASLINLKNGYPGFKSSAFSDNWGSHYMEKFDAAPGKPANQKAVVFQDVRTTFFVFLAIYFPAVTGIFTGANMSGDLKNPQLSIPTGTIAAQLTTSFVYFSLALVFAGAIDPTVLRDKNGASLSGGMVVAYLSWPSPWVLLIGSFLSTFGAALQCLCSAPRLLQSIAKDDVIPILRPFKRVTANNEPFFGLILTTIIAECAILLGAMDTIAAVVDFFFLMCYAFVNIVCALHSLLGAPNWRPRFQYYHWLLSLLGAFLCFFIMFSTHWDYAMVSIILCASIYKYVEWKGAKKEWGDGIRGLALTTAQYSLMKIDDKDPHPKNWRPQLLVILSMPWSREVVDLRYINLLNLASQLKAGRGLTVVSSFIRGNPCSVDDRTKSDSIRSRMDFDMSQLRLRGFSKTIVYGEDQILGSISTLIQSVGLGGLKPNTMLIAWPTRPADEENAEDSEYATFTDKLHAAVATEMCLLVAKGIIDFPSSVIRVNGVIDVYWIIQDGGLCLLMAYLLKQHKVWRGCKLRIIAVAQENDNNMKMQGELQRYLYQLRIDAKILIVELADPEISKNAFERTLLMEERTKYLQKMNESSLRYGQGIRQISPLAQSGQEKKEVEEEEKKEEKTPIDEEKEKKMKMRALDKHKVHKMHTAVRLNELILEHSRESQLVLLNLPKPPLGREGLDDYIHYLEVLSDNLNRVLFIRGSGKEVITANS